MARGQDRVAERRAAVAGLGKDLARRARSRCELCGEGGSLTVVEPGPAPEEPVLEAAVLLCARCAALATASSARLKSDQDSLRFLTTAIWAELPMVQALAVRVCRQLSAPWAALALEDLVIDDEIEALVRGASAR